MLFVCVCLVGSPFIEKTVCKTKKLLCLNRVDEHCLNSVFIQKRYLQRRLHKTPDFVLNSTDISFKVTVLPWTNTGMRYLYKGKFTMHFPTTTKARVDLLTGSKLLTDCRQTAGWHSTEMPSCFLNIHCFKDNEISTYGWRSKMEYFKKEKSTDTRLSC